MAERPHWHAYYKNPLRKRTGLDGYVNPTGRPSEHERGILFMAPWQDPFSGFPEHARRLVRSLADTGIPVRLRGLRGSIGADSRDLELHRARERVRKQHEAYVKASIKDIDVTIVMTIADDAALMRFAPPRHHFLEQPAHLYTLSKRILCTVFERDRVSNAARDALARVGQVWVANRKDKAMLHAHGIQRVKVIPIPFMDDDPHLPLARRKRMPGPTRFYHIGKWEPRKEQRNILGAFLLAFRPGEGSPKLYMKTSMRGPKLESGYPETPFDALHGWLADERVQARGWSLDNVNQHVFIIQRRLTDEQMVQLHAQGDVYVTLSRGEGYDMPAYDAKLAGNLLVYTPSGGPQDFARGYDVLVPESGSVPCDPFYGWGDAEYLDYDLDEAVRAMEVADAAAQGHRLTATMVRSPPPQAWGAGAVGQRMRDAVEEIRYD